MSAHHSNSSKFENPHPMGILAFCDADQIRLYTIQNWEISSLLSSLISQIRTSLMIRIYKNSHTHWLKWWLRRKIAKCSSFKIMHQLFKVNFFSNSKTLRGLTFGPSWWGELLLRTHLVVQDKKNHIALDYPKISVTLSKAAGSIR